VNYSAQVVAQGMKLPMILDSGAEEHLVNSTKHLTEQYKVSKLPKMHTANGNEMKVKAVGKIGDDIDGVMVCPEVRDNLLSTVRLQQKGYWVILPPLDHVADSYEQDAGFVCDKEGRVMLRIDSNMLTDVATFGDLDDSVHIRLPEITYNKGYYPGKTTVNRVYGLPADIDTAALVRFVHAIGHESKAEMIFQAEHGIANYPVTVDQIKKHYPHDCEICIKGKLKQRKVSTKKVEEVIVEEPQVKNDDVKPSYKGILKKNLPQIYDFIKTDRLEPRNLVIGQQIGVDFYGPILEVSVLEATDKASGYGYGLSVRKDGKKDADLALQDICDHYKEHGHHSSEWNQPIAEIRADSDSVFVSQKAVAVFKKNGIKSTLSPPHQHEHNGLAEVSNQNLANLVTCYLAQARHVPEILWPLAWSYARMVRNLKRSKVPGSLLTRYEEFTGKKPDF
jgi:hypothetical protein